MAGTGFLACGQDGTGTENPDAAQVQSLEEEIMTQAGAEGLSDQEKIRRVEDSLRLSRALDEANKMARAGEFTRAQTRLEDVINKTGATGPYSDFYYKAYEQLALLQAARASQAERAGDWSLARSHWEEAVKYAPSDKNYRRKLEIAVSNSKTVEEQYPDNPSADQELLDKVTEIQTLIHEGDSYYRTGQYPLAINKYRSVIQIDPYNRVARKRIAKVEDKKKMIAEERRLALKEERMREVEERWSTEILARAPQVDTVGTEVASESEVGNIFNKLDTIIIPSLNFRDINIVDAIDFLREQSIALDPERKGVNIVLKTASTAGLAAEGSVEAAEGGTEGVEAAAPTGTEDITFSLNVVNQPLITILDFIKDLTPLKYEVEDYAVFVFPKNETSDQLLIRTYSVPATFFSVTPTVMANESTLGRSSVAFITADVKDQLVQKGVDFPAEASAAYLPKTSKMVVKNTLEQLNLIDQLLKEESDQATQIEIETKYVEFTEDKLQDFSFNWRVAGSGDFTNLPFHTGNEDADFYGENAGELDNGFIPPFGAAGDADGDIFPDFPIAGGGAIGAGTALRNSVGMGNDLIDAELNLNQNRLPAIFGMSAVLDGNGMRMMLTAIESKLGADLLSAPKVTVVNNERTKIRIAREFLYPTEFEPPEIVTRSDNNNNNTSGNNNSFSTSLPPVVVPSTPDEFDTRDVGVVLEIRASATPDRRIELEVNSDVTEFQGFINYADDARFVEVGDFTGGIDLLDPFADVPDGDFNDDGEIISGTAAEGLAIMPVFAVRKVETKVQVIDGQTVILGGFIRDDYEEIEDKVPLLGDIPLLGRLFRSKAERSIKRNLMIFITARIINPDGTPKYLTTSEAEEYGINAQR